MGKSISKIGLILISVIVFPTLFFSVYEVSNLTSNERVIDSIYSSQLTSIVISLNQYANDAVSRWADAIDNPDVDATMPNNPIIQRFIDQNQALYSIIIVKNNKVMQCYTQAPDTIRRNIKEQVNALIYKERESIERLHSYIKNDYRKLYPISSKIDNRNVIMFALKEKSEEQNLCVIIINPEIFIRNNLGPRIQNMAQESLNISVFRQEDDEEVYTNEIFNADAHNMRIKESLLLFKNYEVGIQLVGDPIEQMVNERTRMSTIMIVLMDSILLFGAWFVYRNIRQELKLAQMKSEFVSNVSHEIKTPLALINMYSETLELDRIKSEDKKKEYYKVINKEAKRLARMVNKILNFSKIESGRRKYNFIETDLNELVQQISATYQHHFANAGFSHTINLHNNMPLIEADEEAVVDAISNLIDNAIKYSANIKTIVINSGVANQMVYVEVKDSGIGIEETEQKYIFDKFYRVTDGNLANKAKGSGIGLNIVKHIVEAHGGKIEIKSTMGQGSSFTLYFPIKTA